MKKQKKRNKPYRPREKSWSTIGAVMFSACIEDQDPDVHREVMSRAYLQLTALTSGIMRPEGFQTLVIVNGFGLYLLNELLPTLTDESLAHVKDIQSVTMSAAEHLVSIGQRFSRTGKFGATGDELKIIRESISMTDEIMKTATIGQSMRAFKRASIDCETARP